MIKKRRAMKTRFQHGYSIFSVVHEFNCIIFRLPFSLELEGKMWQTGRGVSSARWWPVNCRYEALPVVSALLILTFLFPFYIYWYENKQRNVQNSATGLALLRNYFNGKSSAAWIPDRACKLLQHHLSINGVLRVASVEEWLCNKLR